MYNCLKRKLLSEKLRYLLKDKKYLTDQILNANVTNLLWKKMLQRIFISWFEKAAPSLKLLKA